MKKIYCCIVALLLLRCSDEKTVTNSEDYHRFIAARQLVSDNDIETEMRFWQNRLKHTPGDETSVSKLAALYAALFKTNGVFQDLKTSDSLYKALLNKDEKNTGVLRALAANAITQHQFKTAKEYIEKAVKIGDKKAASLLILADVSLELGDYLQAKMILRNFKNKNSFPYLIREAKILDHEGKLDDAIRIMEKAYQRVANNATLSAWALTNLADMYGHAARIKDAYNTYLKVLNIDPHNDYALKGIAWIALSHDRKTTEAETIINSLLARKSLPEAYLILAEAAEADNNKAEKLLHLMQFVSLASVPGYKNMYNKYLAIIEAEELGNPEKCLKIANEEIANRPTPQSYDLQAWGYYHLKNYKKAFAIAKEKVQSQTYEPEALYHLGMIYLANGHKTEAREYLEEALTSKFELGPSKSKIIQQALTSL